MKEKLFKNIIKLKEFESDFKKLKKRFPTLDDDLEIFIQIQLKLFHKLKIDNGGVVRVSNFGIEYPEIYKVRKFACRSLKGKGSKSGIRIIYAYSENTNIIEFVEIYYKGDKENEDRNRILSHYKK